MYVGMLCMYVGMLCMYVGMLCMYVGMLCMYVGILCMYVGMLCMYVGMLCMYVGMVCPMNVIYVIYRHVRNVVPQSAPLSLATPLYRFRICGQQQHSSLIPRPSRVTLCLAHPSRRLLFLLCALSLDMK